MASRNNKTHCQCFLRNLLRSALLLVWTVTWTRVSSEKTTALSAEIGGNVTFPCPVEKGRTLNLLYIQRGDTFVNGFYNSRDVTTKLWENTEMNRTEMVLHMYRVNISHAGVYQCYIQYSDNENLFRSRIILNITARYSKPAVTRTCTGENHDSGCLVTCVSHGGYPEGRMRFNGNLDGNSSAQMWGVVNHSKARDPDTMTFSSSSTAHFNCSYGELRLLSCAVGESTSDMFSVCSPTPQPRPPSNTPVVAAAVAVCFVVILAVGLWLHCKYKERNSGEERNDTCLSVCPAHRPVTANGHPEVVVMILSDEVATNARGSRTMHPGPLTKHQLRRSQGEPASTDASDSPQTSRRQLFSHSSDVGV